VNEAREWWLKNVFQRGNSTNNTPSTSPLITKDVQDVSDGGVAPASGDPTLQRAFKKTNDGKLRLATKLPGGDERFRDALVLILGGFSEVLGQEEVTGGQLRDTAIYSAYPDKRIDKLLEDLGANGLVVVSGVHKGKRYSLTSTIGKAKAKELAKELVSVL